MQRDCVRCTFSPTRRDWLATASMQTQPVPVAVATPISMPTAVRSQEEIVSLFGSLEGIEVSERSEDEHNLDSTYQFISQAFQQESSIMNPFGIVTATRGAFPVKSTAEGSPTIATLYVATGDRFRGDMVAAIVLPDNTVLAQWSRNQRPTMIQSGETQLPVSVFGAPYGQMQTGTWGMGHNYVDANGKGVKPTSRGCFQPQAYWCCAAFLCFFPTCAIATMVIACCVMPKVPGLFDLKVTPDGPSIGLLKLYSARGSSRLELKPDTDAQTRTAATLAALFLIADNFIDPPSNGGGGGGGGGGAPHVATMER